VNILLDTHVALWAITDSPRLRAPARDLIASSSNQVWISAATIWEISIKHTLERGDIPVSGSEALRYFNASGFRMLPVEAEHAVAVETLPAHHQDPFDRILVAQALTEPMRLITHDATVARYSDTIIRC